MREHLYQGKQLDNGEWVQGDLVTNGIDYDTAIRINDKTSTEYGQIVRVDPDTVSEFTGLRDKNGKRIFEGNIVRITTPQGVVANALVQIGEYFDGEEHYIGVYGTIDGESAAILAGKDEHYEVIGNKWDNAELLKGGVWHE